MQDRIEKTVELAASVARVWRALTDHEEFGEWFRVRLEGPFVVGELSLGQMTYPGYEHRKWVARVQAMEPRSLFAFTWCPHDEDPDMESGTGPEIRVEFRLEEIPGGTRLFITESGFASLPDASRIDVLRSNTRGWDEQAKNIAVYVES